LSQLKVVLVSGALCALAACVNVETSNMITIDNDGGGLFSGNAGGAWSVEEIRRQVGVEVCGGPLPRDFSPRALSGGYIFSGQC
jgi:hypothetical protein